VEHESVSTGGTSELLTPSELAERWGCSVGHLANCRCARLGPTYLKLGSSIRYRMADLLAYEESRVVAIG
jgi:hypothetical protein